MQNELNSGDALDLGILDINAIEFYVTEGGFTGLKTGEKDYPHITLRRVMPIQQPMNYISVADTENKEIGILRSVEELAEGQRAIVEKELDNRYYSPDVLEILSVKDKLGYVYMEMRVQNRQNKTYTKRCHSLKVVITMPYSPLNYQAAVKPRNEKGMAFMNSIYHINEIRERLTPIFASEPVYRAVLFGSYAKGVATENSDIDIVIDSRGELHGLHFYSVLESIVGAVEKQVDLIELSEIRPGSPLLDDIKQGTVLYER